MGGKLRVVSLAPSVTEILFALALGGSLVGATDHCDYPPEAVGIDRVGGFGAPNVEKLLALSPDLVIAAGFERAEVADVLRRAGIRVLDVRIRDFEELFVAIRQIGEAVDRSQQAEGVVRRMRAELEAATAQNGSTPRGQRPRVFVEIGDHPLMTAGGTSFLDDLIARAGGVNVAHEISEAYPSVSPEKVIEWNPDVILVTRMGRPGDATVQMSRRIGWADISAVKNGRVIDDIHPDLLFRPGPRLIGGVKALAVRLHKPEGQQ
ncbi:MAG: cobalamin-binding protein [Thermoguttaceae bacterium]|jgi:iron complex transport system substrate-binding protein